MPALATAPGTVRARVRVNQRSGRPSSAAPRSRIIEPGTRFPVLGTTLGQSVSGEARWYVCADDAYVWSGACDDFQPHADDDDLDRPDRAQLGDYVPPNFETVKGVVHRARGRRPQGLEGLIVHFDAYRTRQAGNGAENSDSRCLDMLRSGQANGYHYGEISRTGRVFLPEGFDWSEWGSHAGESLCPVTGRTGVSRFYVGFEMNNPGVVYPAQEPDVFCPWFNSVLDANGRIVLDSKGRCRRKSHTDEWYGPDEVRLAQGGNIHKHWYVPYSHAQFETLVNVVLYLARRFPASFDIDKVLGHDEVAPSRKDDPGGALATPDQVMTMAEFRTYLASRL